MKTKELVVGTKRLTKEQVVDRIINPEKYPNETPWYKSNLVSKSYSKYAAEAIMENYEKTRKIPNVKVDERCNYNKGERDRIRDKLKYILDDVEKTDNYIADLDNGSEKPRMEERMCHCLFAQGKVSNFEVKDYQIPTTNGGHDKIDLLLQQGDTVYMTETKKFSKISEKFGRTPSDETMLRCVLEIQTYYQKINHNSLIDHPVLEGLLKRNYRQYKHY